MVTAQRPGRCVVILGATASGKSEVAAQVAHALGGDVVSCDALAVTRGLDIATAKPGRQLLALAPHHLLGVADPRESFSAARYLAIAGPLLDELSAAGRAAVVVGGTGLYLRALLEGLVSSPPPDPLLREQLMRREKRRPGALHRLAARLDPPLAATTPARDLVRLVRLLEHRLATGRRLSADRTERARRGSRVVSKFGLRVPRPLRTERIRLRAAAMFSGGLVDEVARLLDAGVPRTAPALRALGCREALDVLDGRINQAQAIERLSLATRQYAKRQDTWFRRETDVCWLEVAEETQAVELARNILARLA